MPLTYHAINLYNENLAQLNITALPEGPNPINSCRMTWGGNTKHSLHKPDWLLTLLGCWLGLLEAVGNRRAYVTSEVSPHHPSKELSASRSLPSELVPNGFSFPKYKPSPSLQFL